MAAIAGSKEKAWTYHMTPNINIQRMAWHYDTARALFPANGSFFDPCPLKI